MRSVADLALAASSSAAPSVKVEMESFIKHSGASGFKQPRRVLGWQSVANHATAFSHKLMIKAASRGD
jgi:hypothetical protein